MKIIDTHCHPQFPQFDADRDEVIRRALDSGIGMICVGTDLTTSKQAIELAERYEGLYASVGLHPNDNLEETYEQSSYLELARHPKVVAIGEIGLDYYRTTEPEKKELQKKRFIEQLGLARQLNKPVIIHCRDSLCQPRRDGSRLDRSEGKVSAHDDMTKILKKESDTPGVPGTLRGVMHSFNGTSKEAHAYLDEGFYIGLNGLVTFSKQYEYMVRSIPPDHMLLETDAPYLAPAPYRGKRNEPAHVGIVGKAVAAIVGLGSAALFEATTRNAKELFGM